MKFYSVIPTLLGAADALVAYHAVHPNATLLTNLLPDLVANFDAWAQSHRDPSGLFWQIDDRDGMEVSVGGSGYRATINSYMFGDAPHAQIGLARSRDGITQWQRHPANPIIRPGDQQWDHDACYKPYAIFDGQQWLLWYNMAGAAGWNRSASSSIPDWTWASTKCPHLFELGHSAPAAHPRSWIRVHYCPADALRMARLPINRAYARFIGRRAQGVASHRAGFSSSFVRRGGDTAPYLSLGQCWHARS